MTKYFCFLILACIRFSSFGQLDCYIKPEKDTLYSFNLYGFLTEEEVRTIPFKLPDSPFYKARKIYPNGFNEIFDNCGRILSQGNFRNGIIYTGFVSIYDSYGNFVTADLYERGKYICSSEKRQDITVYTDPTYYSNNGLMPNRGCIPIPLYSDFDPEQILLILKESDKDFNTSVITPQINITDKDNKKQGHWIYYGKDRPESKYPPEGKFEEGMYIDDRKEGLWIKYHNDGATPKLKGYYKNNRPNGKYIKFYPNGKMKEDGTYIKDHYVDTLTLYDEKGELKSVDLYSHEGKHYFNLYPSNDTINKTLILSEKRETLTLPNDVKFADGSDYKEGFNTVLNENGEKWLEGTFRDKVLVDGKEYIYDKDGVLLKVRVYRDAELLREK